MSNNTPPTEEEIDRMDELYDQEGSFEAVANHPDIEYSRPTVSKWLNRRWEEEEEDDEQPTMADDPLSAGPDDDPTPEPEGDYYVPEEADDDPEEEDFEDILVDEPPEPNDVLIEVLEADPNIKEKHKKYVMSKFDQYGQMSPSDVSGTLADIKIQNKNQTIKRVESNYTQRINKMVRDDPEITNYEAWGTLMTKVTGDPSYVQQARGDDDVGNSPDIHAPPSAGGQPQQQRGGQAVSHQQPLGSDVQNTTPRTAAGGQPQQQAQIQPPAQNGHGQMGGQQAQPPQQDQELSPFEERLIEMLEQQMSDSGREESIQQEPTEQKTPMDQVEELVQMQSRLEQLQGGDQSAEVADQIEGVVSQLNQRIAQLEQKISEDGGQSSQTQPIQQNGQGNSRLSEITMMAQQVDDPNILQTLIEMETDPDVLEAKAKREEIENESAWKKSLAESLSPAAAEQAISAFASLATNLSPPQQAPQQPQQTQSNQQQAQPAQQGERGVEVVDEPQQQAEPTAQQQSEPADVSGSPLRDEGRAEAQAVEVEEEPEGEDETDDEEAEGEEE